jgi:hypothetical protein
MFGVAFEGVERVAPVFFSRTLIGLQGCRADYFSGEDFLDEFGLGVARHAEGGAGFVEPVDFAIEVVEPEEDADEEEGDRPHSKPAGHRLPQSEFCAFSCPKPLI